MSRVSLLAAVAALVVSSSAVGQNPTYPGPVSPDRRMPGNMPQDGATNPNSADRLFEGIEKNKADQFSRALRAALGRARPAKSGDIAPGKVVNDNHGEQIASIEALEADGVVLSTGTSKIKVPAEAFGVNKKGLLLDMTKADFSVLVAQAAGPGRS